MCRSAVAQPAEVLGSFITCRTLSRFALSFLKNSTRSSAMQWWNIPLAQLAHSSAGTSQR
jgi:hypothetical protein